MACSCWGALPPRDAPDTTSARRTSRPTRRSRCGPAGTRRAAVLVLVAEPVVAGAAALRAGGHAERAGAAVDLCVAGAAGQGRAHARAARRRLGRRGSRGELRLTGAPRREGDYLVVYETGGPSGRWRRSGRAWGWSAGCAEEFGTGVEIRPTPRNALAPRGEGDFLAARGCFLSAGGRRAPTASSTCSATSVLGMRGRPCAPPIGQQQGDLVVVRAEDVAAHVVRDDQVEALARQFVGAWSSRSSVSAAKPTRIGRGSAGRAAVVASRSGLGTRCKPQRLGAALDLWVAWRADAEVGHRGDHDQRVERRRRPRSWTRASRAPTATAALDPGRRAQRGRRGDQDDLGAAVARGLGDRVAHLAGRVIADDSAPGRSARGCPPAVTSTRRPARSPLRARAWRGCESTIVSGAASRPRPTSPLARWPLSGSTTTTPRARAACARWRRSPGGCTCPRPSPAPR